MGLSKNHAAGEKRVGVKGLPSMDGRGKNEGKYARGYGTSCRKVLTYFDGNVTEISNQFQLPIRFV